VYEIFHEGVETCWILYVIASEFEVTPVLRAGRRLVDWDELVLSLEPSQDSRERVLLLSSQHVGSGD